MSTLRLHDGKPEVEIKFSSLTPELVARLPELGLDVQSHHLAYARAYGRLDLDRLGAITALPEVLVVRQTPRFGLRVGAAENQARLTMNVDHAASLGYTGSGVVVGILSDSFRDLSVGSVTGSGCARAVTGTSSQATGDLPGASGEVVSLDDGPGGGSDAGRAMAELIHDLAPGARFAFHSALSFPTDFATGISELAACGADLILDDFFYTGQAFFQDDIIAQAVAAAVDSGVPYFSAAGDDATFGIQDSYLDSSPLVDPRPPGGEPNGNDFHDFGGGDIFAAITIPSGCDLNAELQWNEPFDNGAVSDLDLYLLSTAEDPASTGGANVLDSSTGPQGCGIPAPTGGTSMEEVAHAASGSETVFLAIDRLCGTTEPVELRVVNVSFDCSIADSGWSFETSIFTDAQIFGHPAAKGAVAVAAAYFAEIDSGGTLDPPATQLDVEAFTSLGGDLPFYFDSSGAPAPETRFKPEITGPDGVANTFFPTTVDPAFFGTSAAVANVAAVAALALDATDQEISPGALTQLLQQSTHDMETPGRDALSGDGFLDAEKTLRSLDDSLTPLNSSLTFDLGGGSFLKSVPAPLQPLLATDQLILSAGDYSGLHGHAATIIFADGFESGNTSAWSNDVP